MVGLPSAGFNEFKSCLQAGKQGFKEFKEFALKGKLIDANKKYKVAGWAPVAEEAKSQNLKPVWEIAEQWLKASGGKVGSRKLNTPKLEGVLPNPGWAS